MSRVTRIFRRCTPTESARCVSRVQWCGIRHEPLRRRNDVRIDSQQHTRFSRVPGLLGDLTHHRIHGIFARVDAPARQCPARPTVLVSVREPDAVIIENHAIRGNADIHSVTMLRMSALGVRIAKCRNCQRSPRLPPI